MNTSRVDIHTTALIGTSPTNVLREGSSVFVRILAKTGAQTYAVSIAGGRANLISKTNFAPGTTFTAKITLKNAVPALVLQNADASESEFSFIQNFDAGLNSDGTIADAQLAAYFTSLNLPPDRVSLVLVSQMKMLGVKFDGAVMKRARNAALAASGNGQENAETAFVLESKGIPASANFVEKLLEHGEKKENSGESLVEQGEDIVKDIDTAQIQREVKVFFEKIFSGSSDAEKHAAGLLTLFNHRCPQDSGRSWFQIPFDFSISEDEDNGKGVLRVLFDEKMKRTEKISIIFKKKLKSYFFVLYCNKKSCMKALYSLIPSPSEITRKRLTEQLQSLLKMEAEWVEPETISGFCTDFNSISVIQGCV